MTGTSDHVADQTLSALSSCDYIALALDETRDIDDVAQIAVYTRHYDGFSYQEKLLDPIPLTDHI